MGWTLKVIAVLIFVGSATSCDGPVSAPATSESPFAAAFYEAHGRTPPGVLKVAPISRDTLVDLLAAELDPTVPVVLPGVLPRGYERAAPFRGTGSGAALPNPQVWSSGYALTYTDGSGRLTLVVNPDGDPAAGPWRRVGYTVGGRALLIQERDALVVVRTAPDGGTALAVVGEGLPAETVLQVARSLRGVQSAGG